MNDHAVEKGGVFGGDEDEGDRQNVQCWEEEQSVSAAKKRRPHPLTDQHVMPVLQHRALRIDSALSVTEINNKQ